MSTVVIGGKGRIGKRYCAIFQSLGYDYTIYDRPTFVKDDAKKFIKKFTRAIICTPTESHYDYCNLLIDLEIDFLCEKPVSKNLEEIERLIDKASRHAVAAHVVCNYKILLSVLRDSNKHLSECKFEEYNYYNTGKDGLYWDCCQLIYLNPNIKLRLDSPIWKLRFGDLSVHYEMLEASYITMIQEWLLQDYHRLWTLYDGYNMTKTVFKRMVGESNIRNTSAQLQ